MNMHINTKIPTVLTQEESSLRTTPRREGHPAMKVLHHSTNVLQSTVKTRAEGEKVWHINFPACKKQSRCENSLPFVYKHYLRIFLANNENRDSAFLNENNIYIFWTRIFTHVLRNEFISSFIDFQTCLFIYAVWNRLVTYHGLVFTS